MAATPAPLSTRDEELKKLQDKVRIMQKHGTGLSDKQIEEFLELEERAVRRVEEARLRVEREAADRVRIAAEIRQIARNELGKKILLSLNRERVTSLNALGAVACPSCKEDFLAATDALLEMADLLRSRPDLYTLIGRMYTGAKSSGISCIYTVGTCSHCGAGMTILVQPVL